MSMRTARTSPIPMPSRPVSCIGRKKYESNPVAAHETSTCTITGDDTMPDVSIPAAPPDNAAAKESTVDLALNRRNTHRPSPIKGQIVAPNRPGPFRSGRSATSTQVILITCVKHLGPVRLYIVLIEPEGHYVRPEQASRHVPPTSSAS